MNKSIVHPTYQSGFVSPDRPPAWMVKLRAALPLLPALLFLGVFFFYPVIRLLALSLLNSNGHVTAANYSRIASDPVYIDVLKITFKISLWTTVVAIISAYPVAYLLANSSMRKSRILTIWVLIPFWTSFLVRTFAWILLLGQNGLINRLLISLGVAGAPISLLYNMTGTLVGMIHAMIPLAILTMLPVMQKIDPNLVRAAGILGAPKSQAFWRIYFPQSLPGVSAAAIMVFITSLGFFISPSLLGGPHETMITQLIITQIQELLNWGFAGALAVLLLIATFVVFFAYDRILGIASLTGQGRSASSKPGAASRLGAYVLGAIGSLCALIELGLFKSFQLTRANGPGRLIVRKAFFWLVIGFLLIPELFLIPASFTAGEVVEFPPAGFSLRWYETYFTSPAWRDATINSFTIGLASAFIALVIGSMAAFAVTRARLPGKSIVLAMMLSPLIVPRVVIAVGLFYLYSKVDLVGTLTGLTLGHAVLSIPYVFITVMAILTTYDDRLDQAASTLGANRAKTLWYITLPQLKGGLVSAFLFAFITSFDELTIALFVTGGIVSTLPRQMWGDMVLQVNPTLAAVSSVLLAVVTALLLVGERLRHRRVD
ncbi:ABC transporter permease subunit [Paraburkholderia domus]|uniref:ABC transporter permease subunit n=1 Tax=Paraburkholderia domus TaxID=2793075 RepID=UPI001B2D4F93|nr:ABC transporter permease subunit [Paraburkholderia domus]CAE6959247.1 hypothetical protein R70199_07187 [Paraburkholderia domus]